MSTLVDTREAGATRRLATSSRSQIRSRRASRAGRGTARKVGEGAQSDVSGQGEGGGPVDDHGVARAGKQSYATSSMRRARWRRRC